MSDVVTYSKKKDGNKKIAENFKVKEFACKDGSDKVLISTSLVAKIQTLRNILKAESCKINSGYRTTKHNKSIGGSNTSKHCKGLAADVVFYKDGKVIPAKVVCQKAQDLFFCDGIAIISKSAVHLDVRGKRKWFDETNADNTVPNFYHYFGDELPIPTATLRKGYKSTDVMWVQHQLNHQGFSLNVDGSFGGKTLKAVKSFQKRHGLKATGVVNSATLKLLNNDGVSLKT